MVRVKEITDNMEDVCRAADNFREISWIIQKEAKDTQEDAADKEEELEKAKVELSKLNSITSEIRQMEEESKLRAQEGKRWRAQSRDASRRRRQLGGVNSLGMAPPPVNRMLPNVNLESRNYPAKCTLFIDGFNFYDNEFTVVWRACCLDGEKEWGNHDVVAVNIPHQNDQSEQDSHLLRGQVFVRYASLAAVKDAFHHFSLRANEWHYDRIVRAQQSIKDIVLEHSHKFENRYGQVKRFKEIWESTRSQQFNTIKDRIEQYAPVNGKIRRDLSDGAFEPTWAMPTHQIPEL